MSALDHRATCAETCPALAGERLYWAFRATALRPAECEVVRLMLLIANVPARHRAAEPSERAISRYARSLPPESYAAALEVAMWTAWSAGRPS